MKTTLVSLALAARLTQAMPQGPPTSAGGPGGGTSFGGLLGLLGGLLGGQPGAQPGGQINSPEALASPGTGKYAAVEFTPASFSTMEHNLTCS
jgi:hypothetical protein